MDTPEKAALALDIAKGVARHMLTTAVLLEECAQRIEDLERRLMYLENK